MCNHCLLGQKFHIRRSIRADRCHKDTLPWAKPAFIQLPALTCRGTSRGARKELSNALNYGKHPIILFNDNGDYVIIHSVDIRHAIFLCPRLSKCTWSCSLGILGIIVPFHLKTSSWEIYFIQACPPTVHLALFFICSGKWLCLNLHNILRDNALNILECSSDTSNRWPVSHHFCHKQLI